MMKLRSGLRRDRRNIVGKYNLDISSEIESFKF